MSEPAPQLCDSCGKRVDSAFIVREMNGTRRPLCRDCFDKWLARQMVGGDAELGAFCDSCAKLESPTSAWCERTHPVPGTNGQQWCDSCNDARMRGVPTLFGLYCGRCRHKRKLCRWDGSTYQWLCVPCRAGRKPDECPKCHGKGYVWEMWRVNSRVSCPVCHWTGRIKV